MLLFFGSIRVPLGVRSDENMNERKRAAAYARVSTNSRSQEHSFNFQSKYWMDVLSEDPRYEFVGLFADKGISGKSMDKRPEFMRLIEKAKEGEIDIIFTKSVQRFGRNAEEMLTVVRELRDYGVAIVFEKEGINTLEITSDLYLTIAVAVAEDDLTRYSNNVKWSIKEKYKRGENSSLGGRIYGFNIGKNAVLSINEDEAKVVRRIFDLYIEGKSLHNIIDILNDEGIPSALGNKWGVNAIRGIINQEKYVGDICLQKSYNYKGVKLRNKGEVDKYYVENHHPAIITRDIWNKCQEVILKKRNFKQVGRVVQTYPFTGLIECGCCHQNFRHKYNHSDSSNPRGWFRCQSTRDVCDSSGIRDDILEELFIEVFNEFIAKRYKGEEESDIQTEIDKLTEEQHELVKLNSNGWITKDAFQKEFNELKEKLNTLERRIKKLRDKRISDTDYKKMTVFDPTKVSKFINKCVINGSTIEFEFYNGIKLKRNIVNRRILCKHLHQA